MNRVSLPVPPLNEQRRIVAKIEELTARSRRAREALEAVPPLLEQLRQSVLAAAFSGRLTADWRKKNPDVESASVLLERIRAERRRRWEENELTKLSAKGKEPKDDQWKAKYKEPEPVDATGLPDLPEGWCWASVDTIGFVTKLAGFEYTKYVSYDESGDLPVIKAENAGKYGFRHTAFSRVHSETVSHLTRSALHGGDVLIVFVGAGVGQVARVPNDRRYFLGPNIAMIRVESPQVSGSYLELYLRSPVGNSLALSFSKAVAQPSLSMGTIRKIPVAIPPLDEQTAIVQSLKIAHSSCSLIGAETAESHGELGRIDQSILAKAFRGELVPQDPNDEPASALLERIRAQRAAAETDKKWKSSRPLRLRGENNNRKDAKTAKKPTAHNDPLQTVLHFLQSNPGPHSKHDILTHTNLDHTTWPTLAPQLNNDSRIHRTGQKRATKYQWERVT